MGFFRQRDDASFGERSLRPSTSVTGRALNDPEEIGGRFERRTRLMSAAVRRLASHPLSQQPGTPVGDGAGLEDAVTTIRPLFENELSIARWVGLRGALLYLDMLCENDDQWLQMMPAMGLRPEANPRTGEPSAAVFDSTGSLSPAVKDNVLGLFWSITTNWSQYKSIAQMSIQDVNAHPDLARIGPSLALDWIAWTSIAFARLGELGNPVIAQMPEPSALEEPGWHVEPVFGKCERYWDGSDWTDRIRVQEGRGWRETVLPLK